MTAEKKKKEESKAKVALKTKESSKIAKITFTCKFCEQSKPLTEMAVLTRFFPPVVVCKDCEKSSL